MNNHLSPDQFAKCIVGRPAKPDLQHIRECPECRAELERFGNTISRFRSAIRHRIDDRVALHTLPTVPLNPPEPGMPKWRWAVVFAAMVILVMIPFVASRNEPQDIGGQAVTETTPDAVMNAVNLHLSRTVPAPMEPMMSLIPIEELAIESEGVQ